MKRVGRILFCLLPLLITIALQNLAMIPLFGITAIATLVTDYQTGASLEDIFHNIFSLWTSGPFTICLSMFYAIAALIIFGYWYRKKLAVQQEKTSVTSAFNTQIAISLLLLAVGLQYITSYLMNFVGAIRPDWMQSYMDLVNTAGIGTLSPLIIVYSCIIAPISEELIFRGVTLGYAKKAMSVVTAVCLQAILFGIFHMNMIQGIYAAFLGLFLGYLCETGGTILISIVFHAFFNICGTFFSSYMFYGSEKPFFFMLWLTVGVLLTYAGIFLFQHGIAIRDHVTTANQ